MHCKQQDLILNHSTPTMMATLMRLDFYILDMEQSGVAVTVMELHIPTGFGHTNGAFIHFQVENGLAPVGKASMTIM